MQVRWTRPALSDLAEIHDYIAADNPVAARAAIRRIRQAANTLGKHPTLGRTGRVPDTRELVSGRLPYVIAYRIAEHEVDILAVIHGARRWPDFLPG
ncbi:MAG: type II toxin-antitoxin system RelE/ParE family toxin [Gammaproteobacteria bacterium]|nr:MAG: type II toxin-antitoxin system RelE/ParE family toxin [Gammaproteobacteria bacterium]